MVCYCAMSLRKIFQLDEATVRSARRCYNLVFAAASYLLTILIFALLAAGFGAVMGQIAIVMGLDEKTGQLISYAGISVFVILILVSCALAIGDAIRLIGYYVRDWKSDNETHRAAQEGDEN